MVGEVIAADGGVQRQHRRVVLQAVETRLAGGQCIEFLLAQKNVILRGLALLLKRRLEQGDRKAVPIVKGIEVGVRAAASTGDPAPSRSLAASELVVTASICTRPGQDWTLRRI